MIYTIKNIYVHFIYNIVLICFIIHTLDYVYYMYIYVRIRNLNVYSRNNVLVCVVCVVCLLCVLCVVCTCDDCMRAVLW